MSAQRVFLKKIHWFGNIFSNLFSGLQKVALQALGPFFENSNSHLFRSLAHPPGRFWTPHQARDKNILRQAPIPGEGCSGELALLANSSKDWPKPAQDIRKTTTQLQLQCVCGSKGRRKQIQACALSGFCPCPAQVQA